MEKVESRNQTHRGDRFFYRLRVALVLVGSLTIPERVLAENHFLDAGIQNFNSNQFDASLYEFNRAKTASPNDPVVHYYIGSALVRLNRSDEAFEEFQKAFSLAPANSQIKELARAALATFNFQAPVKKLPEPPIATHAKSEPKPKPKPATDSLDPDNALLQATGGIPESGAGLGATGDSKSDRGANASGSQYPGQSSRTSGNMNTATNSVEQADVEAQCAEIQAEAKKRVEEMKNNVIHGITGDMHIYSPEDIDEVTQKANEKCRVLRASLGKTTSNKGGSAKKGNSQVQVGTGSSPSMLRSGGQMQGMTRSPARPGW